MFNSKKGFTLIELLIVIAILGTLAVVVLLALNPVQQLARTRDAGRISGATQLGHAIEAYATSHGGAYPANATWFTDIVNAGEIQQFPSAIPYGAPGTNGRAAAAACAVNANQSVCYSNTANGTIVFERLESGSNNDRCTGTNTAFAVYSTANARGGIVCTAAAAAPVLPAATGFPVCALNASNQCASTNAIF